MRTLLLPTPLLLVVLLQTSPSLAIVNDFSAYPQAAQPCLYDSADQAGCSSGASGAELNSCLCLNRNNFVYNVAACSAKKAPSDVEAVYETLSSNCAGTGVTLSVSKQAFLAAAAAATQTTSTPTPTSTNTGPSSSSTPTNTDPASSDNGLSSGTKIGIGVGVGFGVIAAALAAWFIWAYQRRRRSAQSIHSNDMPGAAAGTAYGGGGGGGGSFTMANIPRHEYAQDNIQQAPVELPPVAWKRPGGYATAGYPAGDDKKDGMPLLAELGSESGMQHMPVELPAGPGYLGYSDRVSEQSSNRGYGNRAVTPEGFSPAAYSQSGMGDVSPYTPSRSSEGGTFR